MSYLAHGQLDGPSGSQGSGAGESPKSAAKPADKLSDFRTFWTNDAEVNQSKFKNNSITTSKYTAANFLPKNLANQFSKAANVYFLFMMILQVNLNYCFNWLIYSCIARPRSDIDQWLTDNPCPTALRRCCLRD